MVVFQLQQGSFGTNLKSAAQKLIGWSKWPNLGQIGQDFGPYRPNFENLTPWLLVNSNEVPLVQI